MIYVVIQAMKDLELYEPYRLVILFTVVLFLFFRVFGRD